MMDAEIVERLERFRTQAAVDEARWVKDSQVVGLILTGTLTVMGKPVGVSWPEGLPDGMSEEQAKAYGEKLLARALEADRG